MGMGVDYCGLGGGNVLGEGGCHQVMRRLRALWRWRWSRRIIGGGTCPSTLSSLLGVLILRQNCYFNNVSSIFSVSFSVAILPCSFKNPCIKLLSCTSANRKYTHTNVCPGPWLTQPGHRKLANSMSSSFPTTNLVSACHLTCLLWFPASMSQNSGGGRRCIFVQNREKGNHFLS